MVIDVLPDITNGLANLGYWNDGLHHWLWQMPHDWTVFGQQFNTDVFANFRRAFDNFVRTGQVWALLIGVVIGYLIKGFTSYG